MGDAFIVSRGGSGGSAKGVAAIKATWPEGFTCVCYSGSKKLRAGRNATEWIFMLPFAGEWTVKAGELSETVTVAEGEAKNVTISDNVLYAGNLGKDAFTFTTQKQSSTYTGKAPTFVNNGDSFTASITPGSVNTSGAVVFKDLIDLTGVTAINYTVTAYANKPSLWVGSSITSNFNGCTSAGVTVSKTGVISVDVSSLKGEFYVGVKMAPNANAATSTITVSRIELVK